MAFMLAWGGGEVEDGGSSSWAGTDFVLSSHGTLATDHYPICLLTQVFTAAFKVFS